MHHPQSARRILRAIHKDLQRQSVDGLLVSCGALTETGHVQVNGTLDLARLADLTERLILGEFYSASLPNTPSGREVV